MTPDEINKDLLKMFGLEGRQITEFTLTLHFDAFPTMLIRESLADLTETDQQAYALVSPEDLKRIVEK